MSGGKKRVAVQKSQPREQRFKSSCRKATSAAWKTSRNLRGVHSERSRCVTGRGTRLWLVRLEEQGHGQQPKRTQQQDAADQFGDVGVSVPWDRKGEFDPQVWKMKQTSVSQDIEEKIQSMYAKGMTTSDIEGHVRDIYGVEVSDTTVSRITDKILPVAKEWQQRPLESI